MTEPRDGSFWVRATALITACVAAGAVVGAVGGLVVDDVSRGLYLGISAGAVLAVALMFWLPDRSARRDSGDGG